MYKNIVLNKLINLIVAFNMIGFEPTFSKLKAYYFTYKLHIIWLRNIKLSYPLIEFKLPLINTKSS